jgi:membrane protein implicated in regulation of membrane protease activity
MSGLRTVHAIAVILSGLALALVLFGSTRPAIAILAIVTILLAWSLDALRVAVQSRPETRS